MKVVSRLLLFAAVPFLALAKKNPTAKNRDARFLKKNRTAKNPDARFLKKPKAPKSPKAAVPAPKKSPKATQSPTGSPTSAPTEFVPDVLVFYGKDSLIQQQVTASNLDDDSASVEYYLDLGVVKGTSTKETMAMVQASFTTAIGFNTENDDDWTCEYMGAGALLTILAYSGCDSAASCEAAGVTPTPLIPETVEMMAVTETDVLKTKDALIDDDARFPTVETEFGVFSTNDANFLLAGKGSDDIFLKAVISIMIDVNAGNDATVTAQIMVKDWVVFVEDGFKLKVSESNGYTASPTVSS